MHPKVYDTFADEKRDQRLGFVAFVLVNLLVVIAVELLSEGINHFDRSFDTSLTRTVIVVLPWALNGLVLPWTLIFRRQITVGYLVALGGCAITGIGLGLIAMVTYFVSAPLQGLLGLFGPLAFLLLAIVCSGWFLWRMIRLLRTWWAF